MDKYEYNLKLDQMKSLFAEEKYEEAAEIADTINWNKIKNTTALLRAGEIYEKTGRYTDSRDVLLMAYDRSPVGRNIIYRLASVAVKMEDYQTAQEYYEEFVAAAPHDNMKYVLQYDIKKAQGASYGELISILEELREQEYTEEWAYELAYLYHKAGISEKCINACDELILWFGDGPYVERALELKMLYQPLTKAQEEKYRSFRQTKAGYTHINAEELKRAGEYASEPVAIPPVKVNQERFNTVNLQEEIARGMQQIIDATEKSTVTDTLDNINRIAEEIPYLMLPKEYPQGQELHIETDAEIDGSLKMNFQELLGEDSDGQISMMMNDRMQLEHQITGQITIEEVLEEWERTRRAAEAALQEAEYRKLESAKARALQQAGDIMQRLTDAMPKLDAGITPRELLEAEYLQRRPGTPEEDSEPDGDAEESADGASAEEEVYGGAQAAGVEAVYGEVQAAGAELYGGAGAVGAGLYGGAGAVGAGLYGGTGAAYDGIYEGAEPGAVSGDPYGEAGLEIITAEELQQGLEEEPIGRELFFAEPAKEAAFPDETFTEEAAEGEQFTSEQEGESVPEGEPVPENDVPQEHFPEEAAEGEPAGEEQIWEQPADDSQIWGQPAGESQIWGPSDEGQIWGQPAGEKYAADTNFPPESGRSVPEEAALEKPVTEMPAMEVPAAGHAAPDPAAAEAGKLPDGFSQEGRWNRDAAADRFRFVPAKKPAEKPKTVSERWKGKTLRIPDVREPEDLGREEISDEPEVIEELTEEQRKVFSYFIPVKGMEKQLCRALTGVGRRLQSKETASRGNLIIQGGHGCGKTTLATSFIKVLQDETGHPNDKIGKIQAEALNTKDIAQLLHKVAGGCLIIEQAGDMSRESVITLSLLLEQDTSGVLIILEGTSKGIKKTLAVDEGFARKFTEVITVPIFSNDELVAFARSYSKELGYEIDEMAVLALYNRISSIQRLDQDTTLTEVKEIVDEAIQREARGGMKKYFSILTASRYTDDDLIVLREKDFE